MGTTPLPPRFSSQQPMVEQGRGGLIPTRQYSLYFTATQFWTVQTSVLNAGVQAQISDIHYKLEDANSLGLQVKAEVAALKGDPRLEEGAKALELALVALMQGQAKQDARFRQEIGELYGLLVSLSQQVAETQQRQQAAAHEAAQTAQRGELQVFITQAAAIASVKSQSDQVETRVGGVEDYLDALTTTNVPEGTNLYYTDVRADGRIAAAVGVSVQAYDADLTTWAGITPGSGVGTFLATPSSANLRAALTDETGAGAAVFADAPTLNGQVTVKGTGTSTGVVFQTQDSAATPGVSITDNGRMMGGTTSSTFPYYFVSSGSQTLVGERSSSATSLTSSVVSGGAFRNPDTTNGNYCSLQFLGVTTTAAAITAGHIACVMTDHTNGSFDSDFAFVTRNANNLLVAGRLTNVGDWTVTGSMQALSATAIPAGGTAGAGLKFFSTTNFGVFGGSGAPSLSAAKGSLYLRSDGSGTGDRAYINTDGGTTWTALTTAA